jgi:hypothetical protein
LLTTILNFCWQWQPYQYLWLVAPCNRCATDHKLHRLSVHHPAIRHTHMLCIIKHANTVLLILTLEWAWKGCAMTWKQLWSTLNALSMSFCAASSHAVNAFFQRTECNLNPLHKPRIRRIHTVHESIQSAECLTTNFKCNEITSCLFKWSESAVHQTTPTKATNSKCWDHSTNWHTQ